MNRLGSLSPWERVRVRVRRSEAIGRRQLLRALGGAACLWPLVDKVWAAPGPPKKRLMIFMQNNGTQQANFWPGSQFTSTILAPLLGVPAVAAKTNIIKGVYVPHDAEGTDGNEHDIGFARMWTGERLVSLGGAPWGGGPSVDQLVARAWGTESLTTAVLTSAVEPHPKPGFNHRRSFSYVSAGQLKLPLQDPFAVYSRLFPPDPSGQAADRRLVLRQSVLDSVAQGLEDEANRLGPEERQKLDMHLSSIRDVEVRLSNLAAASCQAFPPRDFTDTAPALLLNDETAIPEIVQDLVDLVAVSLTCGLVRVASLQFGYGGGKWRFKWEGIDLNCHDNVAHLDTSDAGSSPLNTSRLVLMNKYYCSQVSRLAQALDAAPEGSGTALDNTLVVWANEFGRGDHNMNNVPVVLMGKAGGALPKGGRLIDRGPQIFNRLGCTVLNAMDVTAPGFGDAPTCGVFDGL
jgi:hypothetical protein